MSEQVYDDLQGVRNLLSNPGRWCKGAEQTGGGGVAKRWCLIGAAKYVVETTSATSDNVISAFLNRTFEERLNAPDVEPVVQDQRLNKVLREITRALPQQGQHGIAGFNDAEKRTHAEIIKVLDKAISSQTHEKAPVLVERAKPKSLTSIDLLLNGNALSLGAGQRWSVTS